MDVNHGLIVKKIEEEVNNNFKSPLESQKTLYFRIDINHGNIEFWRSC
jgi:hypothetical protein